MRALNLDGTQLCAQVDPEIFFPEPSDKKGINTAKEICNKCHFVNECLTYAVWQPSLEGIWGATTPRQRESMRSRYRRMQRA